MLTCSDTGKFWICWLFLHKSLTGKTLDASASKFSVQEMERKMTSCMGHLWSILLWHIAVSWVFGPGITLEEEISSYVN